MKTITDFYCTSGTCKGLCWNTSTRLENSCGVSKYTCEKCEAVYTFKKVG